MTTMMREPEHTLLFQVVVGSCIAIILMVFIYSLVKP